MKKHIILLLAVSLGLASCGKQYLETAPSASIAESDMFSSLTGAQTVLEGLNRATYQYYGAHDKFGQKAIDLAMDVMGEDMYQYARGYGWFVSWYQYLEHRNINSSNLLYVWSYYYDMINGANLILKNIDNITIYDNEIPKKNNIKAAALIYRAHSYYMLVQLYADRYDWTITNNTQLGVPIYTEPTSEGKARNTVQEVYTQIKSDLTEAITLLTGNTTAQIDVSHFNINAAYAIAARVALTTGDWANAVTYAKAARQGKTVTADIVNYSFDKANSEWIWGAILIDEQQTSYASFFSHIDPFFGGYASLGNQKLLSTACWDYMSDNDLRKQNWWYYKSAAYPRLGYKFTGWGNWTNDYLYIRAGEMYLIEAEAEARQTNYTNAQNALYSLISLRDPSYVKSASTGQTLIDEILMQRRIELWGEGQRFLDIKRLNNGMDRHNLGHTESLWNAAGSFPAGDKNFTFLIPKQEMDSNPNMVQNPL